MIPGSRQQPLQVPGEEGGRGRRAGAAALPGAEIDREWLTTILKSARESIK